MKCFYFWGKSAVSAPELLWLPWAAFRLTLLFPSPFLFSSSVINLIGANTPQFLVRSDGPVWVAGLNAPISYAYLMRPIFGCAPEDPQTLAPGFVGKDWMVGVKQISDTANVDDAFVFTSRASFNPAMVIGRYDGVGVQQVSTLSPRPSEFLLLANASGAVTLGPWVIGAIDTNTFVINMPNTATAPQLVLRSDGTLIVGALAGQAPSSWSHQVEDQTANSKDILRVGDWFIGPAADASNHFVISSVNASQPEFLLRQDSVLFALAVDNNIDLQKDCALELECADGTFRDDSQGTPRCTPWSDCEIGTFVLMQPTTLADRQCQYCDQNVSFSTTINAQSCTAVSNCTDGATFEVQAPTLTSNRQCQTCSICPDGEKHQTAACTVTTDTQCSGCGRCQPNTPSAGALNGYQTAPCSSASNVQCIACTECNANQFQTAACTEFEDTACATLRTCNPNTQYQSQNQTATSDRICSELRVCKSGEEQETAPTSTSNRICRQCSAGTTDDDRDGSTLCIGCPIGHYVPAGSSGDCSLYRCLPGFADHDEDPATPCQACDGVFTYQSNFSATVCLNVTDCGILPLEMPASRSSDAVCGELPTTTTTPASNSASKGSKAASGTLAPAIGAAVGGVLVLVIIILAVLLVRRRRGGNKTSVADTRETVAFSNPMYDEAPGAQHEVAAYDEADNNEGLYSDVQRPDGADNNGGDDEITGFGGDEGGYLDVTSD